MGDANEYKDRIVQGRKVLNFSPDEFSIWVPIQIRFCDTDMMGHINNVSIVAFLETARVGYMNKLRELSYKKGLSESENGIFSIILSEITCVYRGQIFIKDKVQVGIRIPFFGEKIFYFDYVIVAESPAGERRKTVDAQSVQVMYDYSDGKAMKVPDSLIRIAEELEGRSIPKIPL